MLQTRALRALRQEKTALESLSSQTLHPRECAALLADNRYTRTEGEARRFFGGFAASAAAAGIGLGWLLRTISAGGHALNLAHVATPLLSTFFPILGLSNAGLAVCETWTCGKTFVASQRAKRAAWPRVLGHEQNVKALLHARHRERRWVHLGNAITYTMVAAGAPLTFFGGPFGFAVLVPGVLANIACDVADQRIIHYSRGLGVSLLRPFALGVRAMRRRLHPQRMAAIDQPEHDLARIAAEKNEIERNQYHHTCRLRVMGHRTAVDLACLHQNLGDYNPRDWQQGVIRSLQPLYQLLRATSLFEPFAKAVLDDKRLRQQIAKHRTSEVIRLQRRRWSLNLRALLVETPACGDPKLAKRLLAHGEEVLLVQGKNGAMYRRRQLLDMLDARIAVSLSR